MDTRLPDDGTLGGPGNGQQALLIRLDELILSYFDLLDAYSELQKHISRDMSSVINTPITHFGVFFFFFLRLLFSSYKVQLTNDNWKGINNRDFSL